MQNLVQNWTESAGRIYTGVLLFSLLGIVDSIVSFITSCMTGLASLVSFGGGDDVDLGIFGASGIISILITLGIVAGYILFFSGLNQFQPLQQSPSDNSAVGKIKTAAILMIVGAFLSFIPVAGGVLDNILSLIGFIMNIMAFSTLKNSATFPEKGKAGASTLYTAMILTAIGVCIGWIPFLGFIGSILSFIAFIMVLRGWAKIKNSKPRELATPEEVSK